MGKDYGFEFLNSEDAGFIRDEEDGDSYRYLDGSGYYHGSDGSDGYKYADGSGYYYNAQGDSFSFDCYDEEDDDEEYEDDDHDETDDGAKSSINYFDIVAKQERIRRKEERRVEKERKKEHRRRMWRTILRKKQEVGISSLQCREIHCEELIKMLKERDFYNIQTIILEDLTIDNLSREGIVDNISINGKNVFDSVTRFPFGAKIVIVYHMLQRISPPVTLKEAKRKNEAEVAYKFSNAGFVNITKEVISDLITGWIVKVGSVENVTIDGRSDFTKKENFRPDVQIKISYHAFRKK